MSVTTSPMEEQQHPGEQLKVRINIAHGGGETYDAMYHEISEALHKNIDDIEIRGEKAELGEFDVSVEGVLVFSQSRAFRFPVVNEIVERCQKEVKHFKQRTDID